MVDASPTQESPWKKLLHRPPTAHTLAQLAPRFQHRIQLKLHVFNQLFQLTFLKDTYLPEDLI